MTLAIENLALTSILGLLVVGLATFWLWLQHRFNYWRRHNVPYFKTNSILGNFKGLLCSQEDPLEFFQKFYSDKSVQNEPVVGLYILNTPMLMIRNLELIKTLLIKDFHKFRNRYSSADAGTDPLGAGNLFLIKNPQWKEARVKLSPVFTSGKIKQMFPLLDEIGRKYDHHLCELTAATADKSTVLEVKDVNALYTTDVIAIVAYGVRANSLRNPDGHFRTNGKRIFNFTPMRALEFKSTMFIPHLAKLLRARIFSEESSEFLRNTLNYVMAEREKSGEKRNDLVDILLNFKHEAEAECKDGKHFMLQKDSLAAQASIFFSAGFESSSSTMSFAMYELSRNGDVQQRLRAEIHDALREHQGTLSYEWVMELKYLHYVVQEVLRMYPPLPFLDRECTLSKGEQGYSLQPFSDYSMPHGMPIYIPMVALHRDPQYFPDPDTFNPDRFAPENKDQNNMAAYMPFGIGPHNCIGERFGLLQAKVGLINFFRNHYLTTCEQTMPHMILDPRAIILQSKGGIYCKIVHDPIIL